MMNEADLDTLDRFLMSDGAPDDSMGLSDLDGFLTGILIGPELVLPGEWLPHVWGGEAPTFESDDEAQVVHSALLGHYNAIARALDSGEPDKLAPVYWVIGEEDTLRAGDWAEGFLDAMRCGCARMPGRRWPRINTPACCWCPSSLYAATRPARSYCR